MDGIEAIIQKIVSEAELKVNEIESNAEEKISLLIKDANDWAENYKNVQDAILQKEAKEVVERRLTVADLDVRKILLEAKSQMVEKVFSDALEKLCSLKKADYLKFTEKLIEQNAENGDEVILSCDKVLDANDIKKLKVYSEKSLKISNEVLSERGGVMLIGVSSDKNLTFKAVLDDAKSALISKIALKMFGEN